MVVPLLQDGGERPKVRSRLSTWGRHASRSSA